MLGLGLGLSGRLGRSTPAGPAIVQPVISALNLTGDPVSGMGWTVNQSGTMYVRIDTSASQTVANVKAGGGALSANFPLTSGTGAAILDLAGIAAGAAYYIHAVLTGAGGDSAVFSNGPHSINEPYLSLAIIPSGPDTTALASPKTLSAINTILTLPDRKVYLSLYIRTAVAATVTGVTLGGVVGVKVAEPVAGSALQIWEFSLTSAHAASLQPIVTYTGGPVDIGMIEHPVIVEGGASVLGVITPFNATAASYAVPAFNVPKNGAFLLAVSGASGSSTGAFTISGGRSAFTADNTIVVSGTGGRMATLADDITTAETLNLTVTRNTSGLFSVCGIILGAS